MDVQTVERPEVRPADHPVHPEPLRVDSPDRPEDRPEDDATPTEPDGGEWVPVAEAARRLGIAPDTVRRRVRRRTLQARRIKATAGGADPYLVWLRDGAPGARPEDRAEDYPEGGRAPGGHPELPPEPDTGHPEDRAEDHREGQAAPGGRPEAAAALALAQARAAEMAVYTQQLLAPYVARIEAQATEIGVLTARTATLQAETGRLRARVAELETPPTASPIGEPPETLPEAGEAVRTSVQNSATPCEGEQRRWWHRLFSWVAAEDGA